jgi:hypothetical protein
LKHSQAEARATSWLHWWNRLQPVKGIFSSLLNAGCPALADRHGGNREESLAATHFQRATVAENRKYAQATTWSSDMSNIGNFDMTSATIFTPERSPSGKRLRIPVPEPKKRGRRGRAATNLAGLATPSNRFAFYFPWP